MGNPLDTIELERFHALGPAGYVRATLDDMLNVGITDDDERAERITAALQAATVGFAEVRDNTLGNESLTHVTVQLVNLDGTKKTSFYRILPTPVVLQLMCAQNCQAGTDVIVTQHAPGGHRMVSQHWPFDLVQAEELVRPFDHDMHEATEDGTSSKTIMRNFGRVKILASHESGPPAWRFPRIQRSYRHEDGDRYAAIRLGWLLHAFQISILITDKV